LRSERGRFSRPHPCDPPPLAPALGIRVEYRITNERSQSVRPHLFFFMDLPDLGPAPRACFGGDLLCASDLRPSRGFRRFSLIAFDWLLYTAEVTKACFIVFRFLRIEIPSPCVFLFKMETFFSFAAFFYSDLPFFPPGYTLFEISVSLTRACLCFWQYWNGLFSVLPDP